MAYKLNPFTTNFDYYESGDTIGRLSDVEFPTPPANNDLLTYNSVTGKWENKTAPTNDLEGLSDVEFPTPPVNDDLLTYNSITGKWENKPVPLDELQLALKSQIFG